MAWILAWLTHHSYSYLSRVALLNHVVCFNAYRFTCALCLAYAPSRSVLSSADQMSTHLRSGTYAQTTTIRVYRDHWSRHPLEYPDECYR